MGQGSSARNFCNNCSGRSGDGRDPATHSLLVADDDLQEEEEIENSGLGPVSVIQFGSEDYFCTEEEGQASLDLVRFGDCRGRTVCHFHTQDDGSEEARARYKSSTSKVVFEPGDIIKPIHVDIIQDTRWSSTIEFSVEILKVVNGRKGRLDNARVSVIDNDFFPTNTCKESMAADGCKAEVSSVVLLREYCLFNLHKKEILKGTLKWIGYDLIKSFYYGLTLWLQLILIDDVIMAGDEEEFRDHGANDRRLLIKALKHGAKLLVAAGEAEVEVEEDSISRDFTERQRMAIIIGLLYIVPFAVVLYIDISKQKLRIQNHSRKLLQQNLFRKFLHYNDETRSVVHTADLTMAMTRDIPEVVRCGYMKVLSIIGLGCKISIAMVFFIIENKIAIVPLLVGLIVMLIYLVLNEQRFVDLSEAKADDQNELVRCVHDAARNIQMLVGFNLRDLAFRGCKERIVEFNKSEEKYRVVTSQSQNLAPFLTTSFVGLWIMFGTGLVVNLGGWMSMGTFLGTIGIFKEIGHELQEVFFESLEISSTIGPLRRLTRLMNHQSGLDDCRAVANIRSQRGRESIRLSNASMDSMDTLSTAGEPRYAKPNGVMTAPGVFAVDLVPVRLRHLRFVYGSNQAGPGNSELFRCVSLDFPQGKVHAFLGPRHQGKSTLLKLLGQQLVPSRGTVEIPLGLRVLHVDIDAQLLDASLYENVALSSLDPGQGREAWNRRGNVFNRLLQICVRCGFSMQMIKVMKEEEQQLTDKMRIWDPFHRTASKAAGFFDGKQLQCNHPRHSKYASSQHHEGTHDADDVRATRSREFLTRTDIARLNMARALFLNPECLVMHMPLMPFEDTEAEEMMRLLRIHVDDRGLELAESDRHLERPRTVFMSIASLHRCPQADAVYVVDKGGVASVNWHEGVPHPLSEGPSPAVRASLVSVVRPSLVLE